jgi:hypothetical protein
VIGGQHELGKGQIGLLGQSDCGIERRRRVALQPKMKDASTWMP